MYEKVSLYKIKPRKFRGFLIAVRGERPSFDEIMAPKQADQSFNRFIERLEQNYSQKIQTGIFGAHMKVSSLNDGPVTIVLDP